MSILYGAIAGLCVYLLLRWNKTFSTPPADKRPNTDILLDKINRTYLLEYEDSSGEETERTIEIKQLLGNKNTHNPRILYIKAFCHLRNSMRTFATRRITSITDMITGEVFDDDIVINNHFKSLMGNPATPPAIEKKPFRRTFTPPLKMKVYLSNGATIDYDMAFVESWGDNLRSRGYAQKTTPGKRKWSGEKSLYSHRSNVGRTAEDWNGTETPFIVKIECNGGEYRDFFEMKDTNIL